jgi:hypothetical protein
MAESFQKLIVAQLLKHAFVEPEGSLPCSQQPANGQDPQAEDSRRHLPIPLLPDTF